MKHLLAALLLTGCASTGTGEIDLFRVHQGLDIIEGRLYDAAAVNIDVDPDLHLTLRGWAEQVQAIDAEVEKALQNGTRSPDLTFLLGELGKVADMLLLYKHTDVDQQQRVRTYGILLGGALDIVRVALEKPPAPPSPQP